MEALGCLDVCEWRTRQWTSRADRDGQRRAFAGRNLVLRLVRLRRVGGLLLVRLLRLLLIVLLLLLRRVRVCCLSRHDDVGRLRRHVRSRVDQGRLSVGSLRLRTLHGEEDGAAAAVAVAARQRADHRQQHKTDDHAGDGAGVQHAAARTSAVHIATVVLAAGDTGGKDGQRESSPSKARASAVAVATRPSLVVTATGMALHVLLLHSQPVTARCLAWRLGDARTVQWAPVPQFC